MTRLSLVRGISMTGVLKFIFVFLGFFVLAKIGLLFATVNHNATPIWPPTGFALFSLIVMGRQYWPAILLASSFVTFQSPTPWQASLGVGLGNMLEALIGQAIFFTVLKNRALFSYQSKSLAIIMTRTDQFKSRVDQGGEITKIDIQLFLDRIDSTMRRIAKIVKGMKNLARDGAIAEYQVTTLEQIIEDALDVCREKFKNRGIQLDVEISANDLIECQAVQICQVLVNLLNNSEHALEGTANPWIRMRATIERGFVSVEVIDSGLGIPSVTAARMMEPFFTTKEVGKGTGLGLSIARNIMEENGGALEYRPDRPNTTFILKFPTKRAL